MIAVLPADCPVDVLTELQRELGERGWRTEASRGRRETVLVVAGCHDRAALESILAPQTDADVIELAPRERYVRRRAVRRLLFGIVAGLALLIAFGLCMPVLAYLHSPVEVLVAPQYVSAGAVDQAVRGPARLLRLQGAPVLLVRLGEERYFALGATCTHMDDCLLQWSTARGQIVCPCHGCVYDVYGNVVSGPSSVPLRSYPTKIAGGEVLVRRRD